MRAVDGSSITRHGVRDVPFELQASDGVQKATMKFQRAGVVRPVDSVGELTNKGFDVHFVGGQGWMAQHANGGVHSARQALMSPVFGIGHDSPRSNLK